MTETTGKTDFELLRLYREFSEDTYAAGFMSHPEQNEEQFVGWLIDFLDEERRHVRLGTEIMADYERAGVPVFRRAYERALAAVPPQPTDEGDAIA